MNLVVQGLIDALFEGNETQQNQAIAQIEELHGYKIRYQNLILAAQKLRTAQESYYKSSPANK
ncbi:hypothetical protein, partial [Hugenholtzia roseola]|uniref:hypothetical protein n=1 Tax=Hugenholtzia roseola TaxID=1002 RepID=UPI00047B251D